MGDCDLVNPKTAFVRWTLIGLAAAVFLSWAQVRAVDGVAGMLQVGETSNLRPLIEDELGEIPLARGPGHDGQIYYAIGLDLVGDEVGPLLDHAAYRYRRILSPMVASIGGVLDGWALLWGQLALGVASMAVAAGLVASMAVRAGRSHLLALAVVLNPGVWLSVQLLTPDAFALALMIAGLWGVSRRRDSASTWFSLSGLAKDVNLATPIPLGVSRRDWRVAVIPLGVLVAWMVWLSIQFGDGFASRGNLGLPMVGLFDASSNWATFDGREWVFLVFALASVGAGVYFSVRRSWLRWPIAAWTALALVSTNWVWDFGNNAARAFAPLLVLSLLSLCPPEIEPAG